MDDVPTCSLAVRFQQLLNGWAELPECGSGSAQVKLTQGCTRTTGTLCQPRHRPEQVCSDFCTYYGRKDQCTPYLVFWYICYIWCVCVSGVSGVFLPVAVPDIPKQAKS